MGLFDSYNEIERRLLEHYSEMFAEMGMPDSHKTAKDILDKAIKYSKENHTYNLPPNFGNIILKEAKGDDQIERLADVIRENIDEKRAEGVPDADIQWWWNLNDVERQFMLGVDEMHRMAMFIHLLKEGTSEIDAAAKIAKYHPRYGDPIDTEHAKGADKPLPMELKDRINSYIEKRAQSEPENYQKEIESSTSFNALVRKEIKAGNI